jgi:Fic family protein
MFIPKYTITNSVLGSVTSVDIAKEVVENSPLIPAWESKLRREALVREIYFGAHLEGNKLSLEDVSDLLDGKEVIGEMLDTQEVLNLKEALKFLEEGFSLSIEGVLALHKILLSQTSEGGQLRGRQVVIKDVKTNQISYTPPVAAELPYLMEDLISWLGGEGQQIHPILRAGITHFELYRLHPFFEANNHIARLVSLYILYSTNYSLNKYLSFEEYFDNSIMDYFLILQGVAKQDVLDTHERDLTVWLDFYTKGVGEEAVKVKDKIRRVSSESKVKDRLGEEMILTERQIIIMEYLHRHKEMRNKDFRKIFPDFSDDTVLRELQFLKKKGLVKKEGNTKRAIYLLA